MRDRIRSHIRSQGVGYVALFLVVAGGTAYATHPGGTNTISSGDIINGEVNAADIGSAQINGGKLATSSVSSAKVVDDSLTGNDVDESTLNLATEAWHEIGSTSEPPFNNSGFCSWSNADSAYNSAAFLRDRHGIVHLKGYVKASGDDCDFRFSTDALIFTLPSGYRPATRVVHEVLTNEALGRVNVDGPALAGFPPGGVSVDPPTTVPNAKQWVSLDGIKFRCAPAGVDGCP